MSLATFVIISTVENQKVGNRIKPWTKLQDKILTERHEAHAYTSSSFSICLSVKSLMRHLKLPILKSILFTNLIEVITFLTEIIRRVQL